MSPAWWAAFGPADTSVQCGDGRHRLQWADGTLHALDHPDAEGELVLAALGGDANPCLDLVMAWGRHSDDLTVLAIGPRSASDPLTIPAVPDEVTATSIGGTLAYHGLGNPVAQLRSSGGGFIRRRQTPFAAAAGWHARPALWHGAEVDEARGELIRLLALGPPFQFRLSAAVAHAWSADGANADRARRSRPALTAALAGRLAPAAASWLDIDPDEVGVNVHDSDGWGELAFTNAGETNRLEARLPVGWLASVWAPGFAVVDGHLVTSVLDASWPTARVLAVRAPGRDPAELTISNDEGHGHWSVTSR